jgi:hypothetical protein
MEFDIIVRIICISSILILNIDKIVWQNYLLVIAVISNVLSIYLGPFIVCPILPRVRSRVYLGRQRCFLYDPSGISIPLHTSTSKYRRMTCMSQKIWVRQILYQSTLWCIFNANGSCRPRRADWTWFATKRDLLIYRWSIYKRYNILDYEISF